MDGAVGDLALPALRVGGQAAALLTTVETTTSGMLRMLLRVDRAGPGWGAQLFARVVNSLALSSDVHADQAAIIQAMNGIHDLSQPGKVHPADGSQARAGSRLPGARPPPLCPVRDHPEGGALRRQRPLLALPAVIPVAASVSMYATDAVLGLIQGAVYGLLALAWWRLRKSKSTWRSTGNDRCMKGGVAEQRPTVGRKFKGWKQQEVRGTRCIDREKMVGAATG